MRREEREEEKRKLFGFRYNSPPQRLRDFVMNIPEEKTVPCELCGTPTPMTGTKRCDRCWELEHRLEDIAHVNMKTLLKFQQQIDDEIIARRKTR